jgi:hypothetical protein
MNLCVLLTLEEIQEKGVQMLFNLSPHDLIERWMSKMMDIALMKLNPIISCLQRKVQSD